MNTIRIGKRELSETWLQEALTWGALLELIYSLERITNKPNAAYLQADKSIFFQTKQNIAVIMFPKDGCTQILVNEVNSLHFVECWTELEKEYDEQGNSQREYVLLRKDEMSAVKISAERARQVLGLKKIG